MTGILLLVVAAALVPTHLAEHAGVFDPLPGKLEDLFLGFPMAGLPGIASFDRIRLAGVDTAAVCSAAGGPQRARQNRRWCQPRR